MIKKIKKIKLKRQKVWFLLSNTVPQQDVRGKDGKEVPMVLLGNKGDMVHLRQVSSEEGQAGRELTSLLSEGCLWLIVALIKHIKSLNPLNSCLAPLTQLKLPDIQDFLLNRPHWADLVMELLCPSAKKNIYILTSPLPFFLQPQKKN